MVAFPGLCPDCLGDDNLPRPSQRFKQFLLHSTWTRHLDSHFKTRVPDVRSCRHPRCRHRATRNSGAEIRNHRADVHRIPSSRKLIMKERGPSMETSRGFGGGERADLSVNYTENHTESSQTCLRQESKARKANSGGGAVQRFPQDNEFPGSTVSSRPRTSESSTADYSPVECSSVDLLRTHRDVDTQDGHSHSVQRRGEGDASRKRPRVEDIYDSDVEKQLDEEWEVQDIIDCKMDRHRGLLYRVVWVGDWEDTWEPSHLLHCPELVRAFHFAHPEKPHIAQTSSAAGQRKRGRPPKKSCRLH
jgi:hypothetical protein